MTIAQNIINIAINATATIEAERDYLITTCEDKALITNTNEHNTLTRYEFEDESAAVIADGGYDEEGENLFSWKNA